MPKTKNDIAEYRSYYLPSDFPVLLLSGEHWKISNIPSKHLHFHNCLEIGMCHSESGYMEFNGKERLFFKEGDITCIPRNIPHTTYSSPDTQSHWSYLFLNTQELFKNMALQLLVPAALNHHPPRQTQGCPHRNGMRQGGEKYRSPSCFRPSCQTRRTLRTRTRDQARRSARP